MAPPKSDFEKQMIQLESEIRRLEAEFNMFFAGRLPRPPWETRARVAALVKKHDQSFIRNTADRFRFESLQNRHAKFIELWERQMTNRELGRPMRGGPRPAEVPAATSTSAQDAPDAPEAPEAPESPATATSAHAVAAARQQEKRDNAEPMVAAERVVKFGRSDDTSAGAARVKELYEKLAEAKKQVGEAPVAFERVAALVKAQVSKFADDGTNVAFKVAMKDGKVSLTVKAEKGEE